MPKSSTDVLLEARFDVWAVHGRGMLHEIETLPAFRRNDPPSWLDEARIRQALRAGKLVAARHGVLLGAARGEVAADKHVLATEVAIAGLRGGSQAYACLGSAARIHEIARLGQSPRRVRLYRERGGPWRDEDVAVLVCSLPSDHVTEVNGLPVTTPARTAVDIGRWVGFGSAVVAMDSALHNGCQSTDIDAVLARCRRWPGIRKARSAAEFADARAATPLESISRVAFQELGLPPPELQVTLVWDEFGNPKFIVDFFWEEFGVIGEADGLLKYDDDEGLSLRTEKLRQEELESLGYIVVRWTWEEIWRRPEWVVMRIRQAMARAKNRRIA